MYIIYIYMLYRHMFVYTHFVLTSLLAKICIYILYTLAKTYTYIFYILAKTPDGGKMTSAIREAGVSRHKGGPN